MKKILIIFSLLFVSGLIFNSCNKDQTGNVPDNIEEGIVPYLKLMDTSDQLVDVAGPDNFKLDVTVGTLFNTPFKQLMVYVVFDGDYSKPYLLKDGITAVPADLHFTMADLVSAVTPLTASSDIKEGDSFDFYADGELPNGTVIHTYLSDGTLLISASLQNSLSTLKGAAANVPINVPCAYALAAGTFHENSADWNTDGDVTLTLDPSDKYTVYIVGMETNDGLVEDKGPLKLVVNPKNYSVTVPKVVLASSTAPWGTSYTNVAYAGTGTFNTCTNTFLLTVNITVDQGSFGTFHFTINPPN